MLRTSRAAVSVLLVVFALVVAATAASPGVASGADRATGRIVGGSKPSQQQYDTMLRSTVALVSMDARSQWDGQFCGGMLIDDTHVLTAGHCIVENEPYTYRIAPSSVGVLVGSQTLNDRSLARSQLIPVQTIFVHPFFNLSTFRFDAAVLRLARPVTDVPTLPILSDAESASLGIDSAEVPALAAGWGDTDSADEQCCFPTSILSIAQTIHTDATCHRNLDDSPTSRFNKAYQICSGAVGRDTCQGDSGGPMLVDVGGTPRLAGIVSHGAGCGDGFYGIYTKATAIRGWVESIPGTTAGDARDASHGPDDSGAPTVTRASAVDYESVVLDVTAGSGPTPSKYTVWMREGRPASATDVYLGAFSGGSFRVPVPPRRTSANYRVLVRSLTTNGESPAAVVQTGPRVDRVAPRTPGGVFASWNGSRVVVTWNRVVDAQSGVDGYDVQRRAYGGGWGRIQHVTAPRLAARAGSGGEVRVRATDWAGNTSPWSRPAAY